MSPPTFSSATIADEVAAVFATEMQGKNVLVTGTSIGGIGFDAARAIAKHADLIIITGHNDAERLKLSEEEIKKDLPSANIRGLLLDLASLAAVRKAAEDVNAYPEPLHVLINNAAAAYGPFRLTVDGLETQMATNHFGPFLFTKLLAPKLLASETTTYTPRIVFVSSMVHAMGAGVDFSTIKNPDPENYHTVEVYGQTKSANILTAIELSKRSKGKLNAYSLHPGVIYTRAFLHLGLAEEMKTLGALDSEGKPSSSEKCPWKTLAEGSATTVTAAFETRLNDKPGAYLVDSTPANEQLAAHIQEPKSSEKLWTVTKEIVGDRFSF
ncbi:hypothetical protein DFH09DRAFT_1355725 [Mycena vulgaris]|nr:hypothetical protein DFH09DRAFT_1355725 [Mycena vulgaris]